MINLFISNFLRFIVLIGVQILLLNKVGVYYNLANPYLYILFIMMLPLDLPVFWVYLLSFLTGLTIDIFSNSLGIHAASCVLLAFVRTVTLDLMNPRGSEYYLAPSLKNMGFSRFLVYSVILITGHHLLLITLDIFRISEFFYILIRVSASAALTLVLVMICQYLFYGRKTA